VENDDSGQDRLGTNIGSVLINMTVYAGMYYYPYLISMVLTGANLFLAIFVMRETLQEKNRTPISWAIANPFDNL
jgi:hypothetical protein